MTNEYQKIFSESLGLTKLEFALIISPWQPSKEQIDIVANRQRMANPHNDSYKPKLQSYSEIVNTLRIAHFKELLNHPELNL